ncbi:MAG TPA: hypothetical protein VIK16_04275 [Candidatus Limnocylindrales bacterium]
MILGAVVWFRLSGADEETGEGSGDEVEERPHRPIVPGLSERESGFPTLTGSTHRVRLGVGRRVAYGRPRVRAVTWVAGQPMVEGVEADDYTESGGLLSLLRRPGGTLVRSPEEIPAGYAGCRIVDHAAEIAAPYSRHGLVIKLAEDDLVGWARHALLRMWAKAAPGSTATPAPPQPAPVPPAAAEYMRAA